MYKGFPLISTVVEKELLVVLTRAHEKLRTFQHNASEAYVTLDRYPTALAYEAMHHAPFRPFLTMDHPICLTITI